MAKHIDTSAPSSAHHPCHPHELDCTVLYQRAMNGLHDALEVLRTGPLSTSSLEHALGRGMRGVTAIKRLKILKTEAAPCSDFITPQAQKQDAARLPIYPTSVPSKRRSRRHFDADYKKEVVHLIRQQRISAGQASEKFNIHHTVLRRWLTEFDAEQTSAGTGNPTVAEAERIRALEERLSQLQSDNELLKRASALFARELGSVAVDKPVAAGS